jgi:hypothetical protein
MGVCMRDVNVTEALDDRGDERRRVIRRLLNCCTAASSAIFLSKAFATVNDMMLWVGADD